MNSNEAPAPAIAQYQAQARARQAQYWRTCQIAGQETAGPDFEAGKQVRPSPVVKAMHSPRPPTQEPEDVIAMFDACKRDDVMPVSKYLSRAPHGFDRERKLSVALGESVAYSSISVVRLLLDNGAATSFLTPSKVAQSRDRGLMEFLISRGWDINRREPLIGHVLLQYLCDNESDIRWCLDHGASVDFPPTLLDTAAIKAPVPVFKLLLSRGGSFGRALNWAVEAAAQDAHAVAFRTSRGEVESADAARLRFERRMAMIRYLVEELKVDVNGLDKPDAGSQTLGTPLHDAVLIVDADGGALQDELIAYLLSRGADASIKNHWKKDVMDAAPAQVKPKLQRLIADSGR